ncbi:molybdenum cofactor biosynthesis protein MoaE [Brevundimonas sp.]|uniref:molybdenum cofactor biosynthesis protein MoaE n=1 Tax=Brevundimonas sp. TaxID=1871086 RepID=UPI001A1BE812|nr:molybdenum cofactor biosynthesis protein MoaE [Brevundimonas sp.]MBJ7484651.1 molybdenum cofactor biosynthesis protein MoaE [Brevundimonas sp.]
MIRVQNEAIDPGALLAGFCRGRTDVGGVVSFTGLTRGATDGAAVSRLSLEAYPGYTEKVVAELEAETRARFQVIDVLVAHRWGDLEVGQAIVFVAVAAEHRRDAFQAADFLMDQLKTRAPFWKKETGPDGTRWIEARAQDHADTARWNAGETT